MINNLISSKIPIEMKVRRQFILSQPHEETCIAQKKKGKKRTVIMYDTPVSNEFIRACGWNKEHLLSHTNFAFTATVRLTTRKCEKCFAIKVIRYRKRVYFSHGEMRLSGKRTRNSIILLRLLFGFEFSLVIFILRKTNSKEIQRGRIRVPRWSYGTQLTHKANIYDCLPLHMVVDSNTVFSVH